MKNVQVKGIVLAENNVGDFDKIVTILTPNLGKISCSAKGSRRIKSQLLAGTQMLCFADYMLFKGSDIYTMNSCEPIEFFYNIREDLDKLTYATYITRIILDVTEENQNSYNTLKLFLNTLYVISEDDTKDLDVVIATFKLRLMKILGFAPEVSRCVICKEKDDLKYFSIRDNGFKCEACAKQDTSCIEMNEATKNAIIYILNADAKKIFNFKVPKESKKELELISSIYLNEKLEKEYKLEKLL